MTKLKKMWSVFGRPNDDSRELGQFLVKYALANLVGGEEQAPPPDLSSLGDLITSALGDSGSEKTRDKISASRTMALRSLVAQLRSDTAHTGLNTLRASGGFVPSYSPPQDYSSALQGVAAIVRAYQGGGSKPFQGQSGTVTAPTGTLQWYRTAD